MENELFPVSKEWASRAHVDSSKYEAMYARSLKDPEGFWGDVAKRIDWMKPWTRVKNTSFHSPVSIKWSENAKLNVSINCIDRHLATRANQNAIIWEADEPTTPSRFITYRELSEETNRLANVLR
ncbi:MAG: acetyl-coenzyme A synthetase N-terminal domain-containing protein, partial [Bdellovibrionota bacterium]